MNFMEFLSVEIFSLEKANPFVFLVFFASFSHSPLVSLHMDALGPWNFEISFVPCPPTCLPFVPLKFDDCKWLTLHGLPVIYVV